MSKESDPTTSNPNPSTPREREGVAIRGEAERSEPPQPEEETPFRGTILFRSPELVREEEQSLLQELEDEGEGSTASTGIPVT